MVLSTCHRVLSFQSYDEWSVIAELWCDAERPIVYFATGNDPPQVCTCALLRQRFANACLSLRYDGVPSYTNHANWLTAGPYMTTRKAYLQSLYQGLGQTLAFFMRQVPASLRAQLDLDVVRHSISLEDEGGVRIYPDVWDHRPESQAAFTARADAEREWEQWSKSQRRFIPSLAQQVERSIISVPKGDTCIGIIVA